MARVIWYCEHCGAANNDDQEYCFACQWEHAEDQEDHLLHGRYQLQTQVGFGGFGCVYRAIDTRQHQRTVAIKQINLRGLTSQQKIEATDAFNREVQILSNLSHAHLPRIYAHFTDPEHWYLVMDYINGETLEQYIENQQKRKQVSGSTMPMLLPLNEVLELALQLCDVFQYLHSRQPAIIFRDLKPANVMRTPYGEFFLIDFGIARLFKPGKVRDTIPFGSPGYAAPEQYGKAQTTPQADIYSLGALLHHLISGEDPANAPFHFSAPHHYGSTDINALEALIARMVALKAESRPENIAEVRAELQRLIYTRQVRTVYPPTQQASSPYGYGGGYGSQSSSQRQQQQQQQTQWTAQTVPLASSRRAFLGRSLVAGALIATGILGWTSIQRYSTPGAIIDSAPTPTPPALSPDGKYIAQTANTAIYIVNATTKKTITSDDIAARTLQIVWSPNSSMAAFVKDNNTIDLFSMTTYNITTIHAYTAVQTLTWSANSNFVATSQEQGTNITIWPADSGKQLLSFPSGIGNVMSLAWSPDGQSIIAGSDQNAIRIYSSNDGTIRLTFNNNSFSPNHMGPRWGKGDPGDAIPMIVSLAWSPDGQSIASGDNQDTLAIWNAQTGARLFTDPHGERIIQLAWSPDSHYLAELNEHFEVIIWDAQSQTKVLTRQIPAVDQTTIAWQADSQQIQFLNRNNNVSHLSVQPG